MATLLDIANLALSRIGSELISELDRRDKYGLKVSTIVRAARSYVAELHGWSALTDFAVIAPADDTPPFEFSHRFPLPSDCLTLLRVFYTSGIDFRVVKSDIYANANDYLYISFVRDYGDDVSMYPAFLIDLIARRAEADLSYSIKKNASAGRFKHELFSRELQDCFYKNDREDSPSTFDVSLFSNARFYNGYGIYQEGFFSSGRRLTGGELVLLYAYNE